MSQWEKVEIGKCCTSISNVKADYFSNVDKFVYIDISAIDRETKTICSIEPMLAGDAPSRAKQIIKKDDVLISTVRPNLNAVAKVNALADGAIASTGFCVLRSNPEVINSTYLYYFVRSNSFIEYLNGLATGASYPAVSDKIVKSCKIPLPPLDIQKQIVARLELALALVDQRKQQLGLMDSLIQSIFYEMFGDPVKNEKGWETKNFNAYFDIKTGKLDSNAMVENGKYPFFTCAKEIFSIDSFAFDQEALLLAGNNAAGKYDVKYYKGKFNAYQRTYVLTVNNDEYKFSKVLLDKQLQLLEWMSKGSNTRYITLEILNRLPLFSPPLPLQRQFAKRVERIEALKKQMTTSLTELEQNFNSLMQQSFGG
ncbi:restriction endonuclease subunit S [Aeromonas piscicola]|uniref:restriction endonuclease subunit S n=1 Tax=Aeromonas piscicola TaxID=600645 RepID=UPI0028E31EB4|nr:restriction endonuclease subunit S [Aeromonas piscicola]